MGGQIDVLGVITDLLEALSTDAVSYVHWKSNEHLLPALRGETDLDLLVEVRHRPTFIDVIDNLGFVPMTPSKVRVIPGIESYLGFDAPTGALVHLDVHYRLVLGEQLIKNHHLPLENWLLSDPNQLAGVPVPRHDRELLMLYIRAMLKTTNRQFARSIVKGGSPLPPRIRTEARWLAELVNPSTFREPPSPAGSRSPVKKSSSFIPAPWPTASTGDMSTTTNGLCESGSADTSACPDLGRRREKPGSG